LRVGSNQDTPYDHARPGVHDLLFGVRILGLAHRRRAPLGLVTTKTSRVETLDQIRARLGQARRVVDADRLALSP
jgi:hypothetical protein